MEAFVMLCDFAAVVEGKFNIVGGGWDTATVVNEAGLDLSLAVALDVDWTETNQRHQILAALKTPDGLDAASEGRAVQVGGEFEVGRPAGVPPGSSISVPLALRFTGLRLAPGEYVWEVRVGARRIAQRRLRVQSPPGPR